MARVEGKLLDTGEPFPGLSFDTVEHGQVQIDDHFSQGYSVVLIYRGHW